MVIWFLKSSCVLDYNLASKDPVTPFKSILILQVFFDFKLKEELGSNGSYFLCELVSDFAVLRD